MPYADTQNLTGQAPTGDDLNQYPLRDQLPASLVTGGALIGARGQAVDVGAATPFTQVAAYIDPPVGSVGTPDLLPRLNSFGDGRIQIPLAPTPRPITSRCWSRLGRADLRCDLYVLRGAGESGHPDRIDRHQ